MKIPTIPNMTPGRIKAVALAAVALVVVIIVAVAGIRAHADRAQHDDLAARVQADAPDTHAADAARAIEADNPTTDATDGADPSTEAPEPAAAKSDADIVTDANQAVQDLRDSTDDISSWKRSIDDVVDADPDMENGVVQLEVNEPRTGWPRVKKNVTSWAKKAMRKAGASKVIITSDLDGDRQLATIDLSGGR